MRKIILPAGLIVIYIIILFYVNFKIQTDLSFHYGKDGGFFTGLEMISIMSTIYFLVLSKKNRIIFLMVGLFVGIMSYIVSYFAFFYFFNSSDIFFYLFAILIFVLIFHFLEKRSNKIE